MLNKYKLGVDEIRAICQFSTEFVRFQIGIEEKAYIQSKCACVVAPDICFFLVAEARYKCRLKRN